MKKFDRLIIHSVLMFIAFILSSAICLAILGTVIRLWIPAESFGEVVWKAIVLYADMALISAIYLHLSVPVHKRACLLATEGGQPSVMRLQVRLSDGKVIRQKLPAPRHSNTPPAEGAEAFHLFGSDHVITLPSPADDHAHCVVCNDINAPDATVCRSCGRTMLK